MKHSSAQRRTVTEEQLDEIRQIPGRAAITNMALCYQTLAECMEAGEASHRLGLFYGYSGYGKSVAAAFAAAQLRAAFIEALPGWQRKDFLRRLLTELGIVRLPKTGSAMLELAIDTLRYQPRPIIIDEFDRLLQDRFIEDVRALHDHTPAAILLIGEEALPAKLVDWERFDNRVLVATAAQPASDSDVLLLRDNYCTEVTVADDLALEIARQCRRITRRVTTNLVAVQRAAIVEDCRVADLAWWGDRPIRTGEAPRRRALGALTGAAA